jgi:hypothetical protein
MCGGVTRDEWNVVAMTRGWNVKESRAVRLKVGLWRRKRPKWRRSAPSILKWIFRFHFKTTKPNKQSVVEPVGLRLLHVTDLFLYFSPISELIQLKIQQQFHFPMDFFLSFKSGRSLLKYNAQLISICLINMFASILRSGNDNDRFKVYLHTWIVLRQTMGILISLWRIDVSFKFFILNECFSLFSGLKASGYDGYRLTWNPCPPPLPTKEEYQKVKKKKKSASANYVNWQTKWSLTIG